MAEFVKGSKLNSEIESVFENANDCIVIISPYIKLHPRFIEILKTKKTNPKIELIIVFGKNEHDISKSIQQEDVEFLMDFPNISIKHEPRLHAKYYANEKASVLSSMNLYDFSQNNNIEFGIVVKTTLLGSIAGNISSTLDNEAYEYFKSVIDNANYVFKRTPVYKSGSLGLTKKYLHSDIEIDELSKVFKPSTTKSKTGIEKPTREKLGYCIRTGEQIPFNPKKPFSEKAFESWRKFKNEEYPEKFCHYSGEESNGETSFSKPVLKKNWRKAQNLN